MRLFFTSTILCVFLSCSEEIIYLENPITENAPVYFDKAQELEYPKGLLNYNEDNPNLYVNPHHRYSRLTAPQMIIDIINTKKAHMGELQEKFMFKSWWTSYDRILVTDYNANLSNTVVFDTNESTLTSFALEANYLQLTKNDSIIYYLPVRETKINSRYYLSVSEVAWQNHDKTEGKIYGFRFHDNIHWKVSNDSLIINEKHYWNTQLSINLNDKSGIIKRQFQDSLRVLRWDALGHGDYSTSHLETGKSNKVKLKW